jgi:glycosyltransferase involved in cell wall biosynthesis
MVVTPALQYGSWAWISDIIGQSPETISWTVVGYGRRPAGFDREHVRFLTVSVGDYVTVGRLMSRPALLWLNLLYVAPLCILSVLYSWIYRPDVVIANGLATSIMMAPAKWLTKGRLIVAFHGATGHWAPFVRHVLGSALKSVDRAICNSEGSVEDLALCIRNAPITHVPHWATPEFFGVPLAAHRSRPKGDLHITFVGRLDEEKVGQCLRVAEALMATGPISLVVVGTGPLADQARGIGAQLCGYVSSPAEMAQHYAESDVTWSPADTTYLARPGIEALASGCPIIVSDIPAVGGRCDGSVRIPHNLVPRDIGWVVDGSRDDEAIQILEGLRTVGGPPDHQREACRAYAQEHHGLDNIEDVISAIRATVTAVSPAAER